jgi:hypothetical protein
MNDPSLAPYNLMDSVYASGNPNRPDTLYGPDPVALVRNGEGRIVLMLSIGSSTDSTTYRYDAQGRLISKITVGDSNTPDTLLYLYSWNDAAGLRPTSGRAGGARIVGHDLELDLSAFDRVRVDILDLDGKRLGAFDRNFPAGRTMVPIQARTGNLVRVRSSHGESVLRIPPSLE